VGFNWWRETDDMSAQAIIDRVQAEWRAGQRRQQSRAEQSAPGPGTRLQLVGSPHAAPERPLNVDEAHREMQRHRECRTDQCPLKAAARHTLIEAGHITPDPSRNY
jgi:hypothetical protein